MASKQSGTAIVRPGPVSSLSGAGGSAAVGKLYACGCVEYADSEIELCPEHVATVECNADADHPCDAANGEPCASCQVNHDYWAAQWESHGRREVANRYTEADIEDCYSEPCEASKRAGTMREIER